MPLFDVIVTVDVTQSAIVRVEAEDADNANNEALAQARSDGAALTWNNDDCGHWSPYIADWDTAATEVEPEAAPPVWIVQGEHWNVPGVPISAHASKAAAWGKAAELVNVMLDDTTAHENSKPRPATASDWQTALDWLQDYHGAAHCWVSVSELSVEA